MYILLKKTTFYCSFIKMHYICIVIPSYNKLKQNEEIIFNLYNSNHFKL